MRILVDTHVFIWHLEDDPALSLALSELIENPDNEILISIASIWEMAIKMSRGKLTLSRSIEDVIRHIERSKSSFLTIDPTHLARVVSLPFYHKDPFDRLIIAQALTEDIPIITSDRAFAAYGVDSI